MMADERKHAEMPEKKHEPWAEHPGLVLGIKLVPNGMGWTLVRPTGGAVIKQGREGLAGITADEKALAMWRAAGCPENVKLYKYANEEAYRASPDKDGMSRQEHSDKVDRMAAKFRRHGAKISIEIVEHPPAYW